MADVARRVVLGGLALALAIPLAACGRRADLDSPYEAQIEARREAEENDKPLPPEPTPPPADRKFILDGLI
jgi:predicted small lipoprotein YifL